MKKSGRYDTSKLVEAQFEPGSQGRVLKNLLCIKRKREMDEVESISLKTALDRLSENSFSDPLVYCIN